MQVKRKVPNIIFNQNEKQRAPDLLHFVWIGDANKLNTNYIDVWSKTNIDKKVNLWHDENTSLINSFHEKIREYALNHDFDNAIEVERKIKNDAFNFLFPKLCSGCCFDKLIIDFFKQKNIPCQDFTKSTLDLWANVSNVIVMDIKQLFNGEFKELFRFYCYELVLRGNLASASDIVRLLIIYRFGGVYIDVDTLPYTDNFFQKTNQYLKENKIIEDDFIRLSKTEAILKKIDLPGLPPSLISILRQKGTSICEKQFSYLIESDMKDFSLQCIEPLGKIFVHKNLLLLGSLKRLKGVFFNNVICSHANSKIIRIIIRVICRRYVFLEKNDCIFNFNSKNNPDNYLSRLLGWRDELITGKSCVTPILTGPGIVIEVLLGMAYSLFDIDISTPPETIAEYMQRDSLGIAFFQHNLDTPEGVLSTWRK